MNFRESTFAGAEQTSGEALAVNHPTGTSACALLHDRLRTALHAE